MASTSQSDGVSKSLLILQIEDNSADAELALLELSKAGFEVSADVVDTLADVASRMAAKFYDVVLTDYRLPGWAGIDALPIVRQHQANIPFILVSGTGVGISKELQEQIFEPFFTTKEVGKGTGLGLSTVYGIMKQSNGYLWVASELGQGACFTIYLPRVNRAIAPDMPAAVDARLLGTETILVAEDEEALREAVCDYLSSLGYTVLAASSGKEALSAVSEQEGHIDLLITDVVMPGMSGRELSEMLGSLYPDLLKTIFMSGYTDDAVLRHGIHAQGATFLQKPFAMGTLARKVRDTLGQTDTVQ